MSWMSKVVIVGAVTGVVMTGLAAGVAFADIPASIHAGNTGVHERPSFRAPVKFKAEKGERVSVKCETPDPEQPTLVWRNIIIRGVEGWSVDVVRDNPSQRIPACDEQYINV